MASIISTNPSLNYTVIGEQDIDDEASIQAKVKIAQTAQLQWKKKTIFERVDILTQLYLHMKAKKEDIAISISQEMGMPIKEARDEVQYGLNYFIWYLENAQKYLNPEVTFENETEKHLVFYEPKGVVVAIAPWNYPSFMFVWTCIQPLLAGNTVVFKTSKEVILTGKLIADIVASGNIPQGVLTQVYGDGKVGDILTKQGIDCITFTGSTHVGKNIAKIANEKWISCVMELGGSAPGIICQDAHIDDIIESLYFLRFSNCGQMCDGLKRLIVHVDKYDELKTKLTSLLAQKTLGVATQENTDIGPLVSETQKNNLVAQYEDALNLGANIIFQSNISHALQGAYFPPTLLENITLEMKVWKEEVFGPILPIVPFHDIEEAIALANDTPYGLGAYVFTQSTKDFEKIAGEIKSGMVQMNNINYCIPQNPFGGYKNSGIGREHGKWGFYEFTNIKVISMPK